MDAMEKRHIQLKNISFVQTDMKERSLITVIGDKDKAKTLDSINSALPKYITVLKAEITTGPPENLSKKEKEAWQLKKQSALDAALDLSASYSQHPIDHLREKLNTSGVTEDNTDAFDESVRLIDINPEQLITIHYNIGENDNLLFEYYKQFANKSAKNLSLDEFESAQTQYNGLDIRHGLASPFDQDMNQCTDYKMKFQFMSYIITKRLKNRLMNLSDKQIDITELAKLDTYIMTAGICIGAYIAAKDKQEGLMEEERLRTETEKIHESEILDYAGEFHKDTYEKYDSLHWSQQSDLFNKFDNAFREAAYVNGAYIPLEQMNKDDLRMKLRQIYATVEKPSRLTPYPAMNPSVIEAYIRIKLREPLREEDKAFASDYENYGRYSVLKGSAYRPIGADKDTGEPLFRSFSSYNSFKSIQDMPEEKYEQMLKDLSAHGNIDAYSTKEETESAKAENMKGLDTLREATAAHYDYLFRKYGTGLHKLKLPEIVEHYDELVKDSGNIQVDRNVANRCAGFIRADRPEDQLLYERIMYFASVFFAVRGGVTGIFRGGGASVKETEDLIQREIAIQAGLHEDKMGAAARNSVNWGEPYYKN